MIEISVNVWVYLMYVILAGIGAAKIVDWIFILIYKFVSQEKAE